MSGQDKCWNDDSNGSRCPHWGRRLSDGTLHSLARGADVRGRMIGFISRLFRSDLRCCRPHL